MRGSLFLLAALAALPLLAPHADVWAAPASSAELVQPDVQVPADAPAHTAAPTHDATLPDAPAPDPPPGQPAGGAPALGGLILTPPCAAPPREHPRTPPARLGGRVAAFATVDPPPES